MMWGVQLRQKYSFSDTMMILWVPQWDVVVFDCYVLQWLADTPAPPAPCPLQSATQVTSELSQQADSLSQPDATTKFNICLYLRNTWFSYLADWALLLSEASRCMERLGWETTSIQSAAVQIPEVKVKDKNVWRNRKRCTEAVTLVFSALVLSFISCWIRQKVSVVFHFGSRKAVHGSKDGDTHLAWCNMLLLSSAVESGGWKLWRRYFAGHFKLFLCSFMMIILRRAHDLLFLIKRCWLTWHLCVFVWFASCIYRVGWNMLLLSAHILLQLSLLFLLGRVC